MKRSFTTTLGAAALVALAATGCKKDENKDQAASGAGGAAGGGVAAAVPSGAGFAVFPATSKLVAGLNLNSARSSALWAKYKDQIESDMTSELAEVKTSCGFDPFTQLQSIVFGGDPNAKEVVVVARGLTREQIKSCGEKLAAKDGKKFVVRDEGNVSQYETDDGQGWGAWLDDSTVVFTPERDKDYASKRAAGEAGLAEGAELMGLLKNVDTAATVYLVATSDLLGANPAAAMMPGAKGLFASFKLGEGLDIDAGIRFDTPDNAKNFTTMVQQQLSAAKGQQMPAEMAGLGKVIEKAVVKQNEKDMVVTLNLTSEELKQLETVVRQMSQMFGGGLGGGGGGGGSATPQ